MNNITITNVFKTIKPTDILIYFISFINMFIKSKPANYNASQWLNVISNFYADGSAWTFIVNDNYSNMSLKKNSTYLMYSVIMRLFFEKVKQALCLRNIGLAVDNSS